MTGLKTGGRSPEINTVTTGGCFSASCGSSGLESPTYFINGIQVSASQAQHMFHSGQAIVCPGGDCTGYQAQGNQLYQWQVTGAGHMDCTPQGCKLTDLAYFWNLVPVATIDDTFQGAGGPTYTEQRLGALSLVVQMAGPVTRPGFIVGWFAASALAALTGAGLAEGAVLPVLYDAEASAALAPELLVPGSTLAATQFVEGASTPAAPNSAWGWVGYILSGLRLR